MGLGSEKETCHFRLKRGKGIQVENLLENLLAVVQKSPANRPGSFVFKILPRKTPRKMPFLLGMSGVLEVSKKEIYPGQYL
jgi:hypothetical protein